MASAPRFDISAVLLSLHHGLSRSTSLGTGTGRGIRLLLGCRSIEQLRSGGEPAPKKRNPAMISQISARRLGRHGSPPGRSLWAQDRPVPVNRRPGRAGRGRSRSLLGPRDSRDGLPRWPRVTAQASRDEVMLTSQEDGESGQDVGNDNPCSWADHPAWQDANEGRCVDRVPASGHPAPAIAPMSAWFIEVKNPKATAPSTTAACTTWAAVAMGRSTLTISKATRRRGAVPT